MEFDYDIAFQRNRGFLSEAEQEKLRNSKVAIAGLGGTGGAQVLALVRMGIGALHLADPDTFELANFNRQSGANMETIGQRKTKVAAEMASSINPELDIQLFDSGISVKNIDNFLQSVDVVVDSLDFYCFEERFLLYARAREMGLWVLTAPPLGFGFTLLVFDPKGMSFEDYFGFSQGMNKRERVVSLIAGIAPDLFPLTYLDFKDTGFEQGRMPSVGAAPFIIAGVVAAEVVNQLICKIETKPVPTVYQFDALLRKFRKRTYWLYSKSPLRKLKKAVIRRRLLG